MTISCTQTKDFELETKDAFIKCLNCCITMMLHTGDGTLTENEFVDGCMSDEAFVKVRPRAVERVVRDPKQWQQFPTSKNLDILPKSLKTNMQYDILQVLSDFSGDFIWGYVPI